MIPFFDEKHNVIGYQGRSFDPKERSKYITIKMKGVDNLLYGQERLDVNKKNYCVEGPLDSLFLPNCLATAGLNFKGLKLNNIIVLDNERRNIQIIDALKKVITNGYTQPGSRVPSCEFAFCVACVTCERATSKDQSVCVCVCVWCVV